MTLILLPKTAMPKSENDGQCRDDSGVLKKLAADEMRAIRISRRQASNWPRPWTASAVNQLQIPDGEEPIRPYPYNGRPELIAGSLLATATACISLNVLLYLHTRSLEYQYQHSMTRVRPWIWPEGACGFFFLVWILVLIAGSVAVFRRRNGILKYAAGCFAAGAFVAIITNAFFLLAEALRF